MAGWARDGCAGGQANQFPKDQRPMQLAQALSTRRNGFSMWKYSFAVREVNDGADVLEKVQFSAQICIRKS